VDGVDLNMADPTNRRKREQGVRGPRSRTNLDSDPAWIELVARYAKHPALQIDTVYALPKALIDVISEEVPDLLSEDELRFERDLARLGGFGFFLRLPIDYPPLRSVYRLDPIPPKLATSMAKSEAGIHELMADEMRKSGRSEGEIERYFARHAEIAADIQRRQIGYLGWLVTNPEFQCDCIQFRRRWRRKILVTRSMPEIPVSISGARPDPIPKRRRAYYASSKTFLLKWGIEALVTWFLPLPMRPGMTSPSLYDLSEVRAAGATIFLPWFFMRDRDINVYEIAEQLATFHSPRHLDDWLERRPKNWGHDRYAQMLQLFIFLCLALNHRYGKRLQGNLSRLDNALAKFSCGQSASATELSGKTETLRRIRLELFQRIGWSAGRRKGLPLDRI
jgi:hypothetical protein